MWGCLVKLNTGRSSGSSIAVSSVCCCVDATRWIQMGCWAAVFFFQITLPNTLPSTKHVSRAGDSQQWTHGSEKSTWGPAETQVQAFALVIARTWLYVGYDYTLCGSIYNKYRCLLVGYASNTTFLGYQHFIAEIQRWNGSSEFVGLQQLLRLLSAARIHVMRVEAGVPNHFSGL